MNIAGRELGTGQPCFIVAEMSCNHNGDLQRAFDIIYAARDAGATAVKFQAFTLSEMLALRGEGQAPPPWDAYTKRELYAKALTPIGWFYALFERARAVGLIPFASVFGRDSLALLEALDCPAYKIAKPERDNVALIGAVKATNKPVLISGRDIYCPGGYPCRPEELRLRCLALAWRGLSCHCPDPNVGPVAVTCGAHYLEFHLTLDDGVPTLDDCVNLKASQFAEMVRLTRAAEAML